MSEKYNTNINSIEEAIKQLEDLKKDRLSFVIGDAEHDNIFLRDVQAIEIVLGNLEALSDMQRTTDKELENARKISEEHKRENGELRNKVKELEEENGTLKRVNNIIKNIDIENAAQKIDDYYNEFMRNFIPKQKIKEKINENSNMIREIEEKIKKEENSGDICEEYLSDLYKEKSLVERDILTLQELLQESEDK